MADRLSGCRCCGGGGGCELWRAELRTSTKVRHIPQVEGGSLVSPNAALHPDEYAISPDVKEAHHLVDFTDFSSHDLGGGFFQNRRFGLTVNDELKIDILDAAEDDRSNTVIASLEFVHVRLSPNPGAALQNFRMLSIVIDGTLVGRCFYEVETPLPIIAVRPTSIIAYLVKSGAQTIFTNLPQSGVYSDQIGAGLGAIAAVSPPVKYRVSLLGTPIHWINPTPQETANFVVAEKMLIETETGSNTGCEYGYANDYAIAITNPECQSIKLNNEVAPYINHPWAIRNFTDGINTYSTGHNNRRIGSQFQSRSGYEGPNPSLFNEPEQLTEATVGRSVSTGSVVEQATPIGETTANVSYLPKSIASVTMDMSDLGNGCMSLEIVLNYTLYGIREYSQFGLSFSLVPSTFVTLIESVTTGDTRRDKYAVRAVRDVIFESYRFTYNLVRPKWSNSALPALNLRASEADKREYFNPGGYYQNLSDVLFQADNNGASTESLGIPVGTSISAEWSPNPNAQQPGQPTKFIKLVGPLTYTRIPLSAIQVAVS